MIKDNSLINLEQLLAIQIRQLQKMLLTETRRLAFLNSDQPERAISMQKECDQVFSDSVGIQKRIDDFLDMADLEKQPSEKQKRIASLKSMVRKLAKRNFEMNQQSQKVLSGLLSEISNQINSLKAGKKMVNSYHSPNKDPYKNTFSGQF